MEQTETFDISNQPETGQLPSVSSGDAGSGPYTVVLADPQALELLAQAADSSQELLTYIQSQDDGSGLMERLQILAENSDNTQLLEAINEVAASNQALLVSSQRLELQIEAGISILLIFLIVGLLQYIYKFLKMFF